MTYNFNDSLTTLISICTLTDTVQGVIILNLLQYTFGYLADQAFKYRYSEVVSNGWYIFFLIIKWLFILLDWWSILPDLVSLSTSLQSFSVRVDSYNFGKLAGKGLKLLI